jgi:hypothetical protein
MKAVTADDGQQDTALSTYTLENLFIAGATRKKMDKEEIAEWLEECEYSAHFRNI